jgi:hypothetical protein
MLAHPDSVRRIRPELDDPLRSDRRAERDHDRRGRSLRLNVANRHPAGPTGLAPSRGRDTDDAQNQRATRDA